MALPGECPLLSPGDTLKKLGFLLLPVFFDAWTKKITHFDHQTTSQIESSHSYIKKNLLNSSTNFPEVVKLITLALESQHHGISSEFHQQKIATLRNIQKIFTPCFGKITHYALCRAQNEFNLTKWTEELGKCNHAFTVQSGIPFKHRIAYLVNRGEKIQPTEFHAQWHMKVSCLFLFLSSFFCLFPFSLFPYPFSFLWGVWWHRDWLSLLRWCGGMLQSNFVAFRLGAVASKRTFFFFFWGSLIQNKRACNILGVVNDFDWRSFSMVQTGGR
jgi:hypothetical protein